MNRSIKDLWWLAGIVEGEGCFTINNRRDGNKSFTFRIGSTDFDVIKKINKILNHDTIYGYREKKHWNIGKKTYYQTALNGKIAIGWMMTLYPLMGIRRKERN